MTDTAPLEDYRWLIGKEAAAWCDELAGNSKPLTQQIKMLRKHVSAQRAHLLIELIELRKRATAKFDSAEKLFFTPQTLEQATDQWIARYKASRFPDTGLIADLCCGIGGDLFELARRAPATGVDIDPVHTLLATANCQALGLQDQLIHVADATTFNLDDFNAWHIDPDRRSTGQRTTQLDYAVPSAAVLKRLLRQHPNAALKTAPATDVPPAWKEETERQWIGSGRECKQQVVWFGGLAKHPGHHSAIVVHHGEHDCKSLVGHPDEPIGIAAVVEDYICEPHAAVLAARLGGTLARRHNLAALEPGIAYFTTNHPIDDPLLSCFVVQDTLPLDMRKLKAAMRHLGIGRIEVKKRGVPIDPADVQRKVQGRGERSATLILTPRNGSALAIICRRITHGCGDAIARVS